MAKVIVRQPYGYDVDKVSVETGLKCLDKTLTVQSERDDADINTLVKRFGITGTVPQLTRLPMQGDFTGLKDYHGAMNALIESDELFMELPADLRKRFDNDAGKFVDFCSNEKNRPELIELGLVPRPAPEAAPVAVRVVPEPPAKV